MTDDEIISFAICLFESQGYPKNSFEMLSYEVSRKFILQAEYLIKRGYHKD